MSRRDHCVLVRPRRGYDEATPALSEPDVDDDYGGELRGSEILSLWREFLEVQGRSPHLPVSPVTVPGLEPEDLASSTVSPLSRETLVKTGQEVTKEKKKEGSLEACARPCTRRPSTRQWPCTRRPCTRRWPCMRRWPCTQRPCMRTSFLCGGGLGVYGLDGQP